MQLILKIGLEHILGEKEYNNMLTEVECMPVEEESSNSRIHTKPRLGRTDQQNLRPTRETYTFNMMLNYR